ncbi:MAG: conserved hypothetical signal peptide protein [Rhizobium sp.]|nr:conserved hypothetical signal peptide protein [Rhizobium sp.]
MGVPALAATSVYTSAATDKGCVTSGTPTPEDEDMGNVSLKCTGYKDYPFYFNAYDNRESTYFGHLSKQILDGAGETFETFNFIGDKIEWRLDDHGVPRATILRYMIQNLNPDTSEPDKANEGQVLVISRVGQPGDMTGCITAYVDALENKDANDIARKLADEQAPGFPCGKQEPKFHGKTGKLSGYPVYNYPDLNAAK